MAFTLSTSQNTWYEHLCSYGYNTQPPPDGLATRQRQVTMALTLWNGCSEGDNLKLVEASRAQAGAKALEELTGEVVTPPTPPVGKYTSAYGYKTKQHSNQKQQKQGWAPNKKNERKRFFEEKVFQSDFQGVSVMKQKNLLKGKHFFMVRTGRSNILIMKGERENFFSPWIPRVSLQILIHLRGSKVILGYSRNIFLV